MANLRQVGIQQLEKLRDLYSDDLPNYCKEFHCLATFLELHRKSPQLGHVKVYALPNLELGLFVIVDRYLLFMGCKESEGSEGLLEESLLQLDWFEGQQCATMPVRYLKAATAVIEAKQLQIELNLETSIVMLSKESALQFQVEEPKGFRLRSLSLKDAHVVDDHWAYSQPGSLFLMQRQILFHTSDGLLAALQVKESHKRRGFGALIVKEFARRLALQGQDTTAEVDKENQASGALFKKLGFRVVEQCRWLVTEAPNGDFQWPDGE
ncbi:hypothetical protein KR009_007918 [Drosophila setifemur]|nr:hypothetical protein KR009_007918 [Drosophila setifemur]